MCVSSSSSASGRAAGGPLDRRRPSPRAAARARDPARRTGARARRGRAARAARAPAARGPRARPPRPAGRRRQASSLRSSSAHSPNGAAPPRSSGAHAAVAAPCSRGAAPAARWQSRVLPMPASPQMLTTAPAPRPHRAPRLEQPLELLRAPDQRRACVEARGRGARLARRRLRAVRAAARADSAAGGLRRRRAPGQLLDERAGGGRGGDREFAPQALGQRAVDHQRPRAVARGGQPRDQAAVGLLAQRIDGDRAAAPLERPVQLAVRLARARRGARAASSSRSRCSSRAISAHSSSKPASSSPRAQLHGLAARAPRSSQLVERDRVHPQLRAGRETDAVAIDDQVALSRGAERAPQRPHGAAQARAGARVEHVRPEAGGELAARLRAGRRARGRRAATTRAARSARRSSSPSHSTAIRPNSCMRSTSQAYPSQSSANGDRCNDRRVALTLA